MSIGFGHRLGITIFGFVWQGLLNAAVVTVDFEGTISAVTSTSAANSITTNIVIGDTFNATYTYDTAIQDSQDLVSTGVFNNALTELYFNITNKPYYWHLGNYTGKLTGLIETEDVAGADRLTIASTESTAVVGSPLILDATPSNPQILQFLQLQFSSADFLTNDAMPVVLPPVSTSASVCLRFDATPLTTACGTGVTDVVLDFSIKNIARKDRFQWANPLPQGSTLLDVVWSDTHQLYVAVGENGAIVTSTNGNGWVNRDVLTIERYLSVATNNGVYVAITIDKKYTSKDGIIWKESDTKVGSSDAYAQVIWDGLKFVVVGQRFTSGMLVDTSVDGSNWQKTNPADEYRLTQIATNNSLYVAIRPLLTRIDPIPPIITTSTDLQTWTPIQNVPTTQRLNAIAWGGSVFVVAGSGGTILTSENGSNWTLQVSNTTSFISAIEWQNNEFIAVGENGLILTGDSTGVTWVPQASSVSENLQAPTNNGNEYIVVGKKGTILRSNDTIDWQASSSGVLGNFNDTVWTGSEFITVGDGGNVATSDNGVDWVYQSSLGVVNLEGVATNATNGVGTHVAVGSNGAVFRSTDPKTGWTLVRGDNAGDGESDLLSAVSWVENQFIAVGDKGLIITSPDGSAWTSRSSNNLHDLKDLVAHGNFIVVVGNIPATNKAIVMTSGDGISWLLQQSEAVSNMAGLLSVTWSGNEFFATAGSNVTNDLFKSHDGVTWIAYDSSESLTGIEFVRWVGYQFIGVGSRFGRNELFSSPDAISWTLGPTYFSGETNYGIAKSPDNLIIVSNSGGINYKPGTYTNNFVPFADLGPDQFGLPGETIIINATVSDTDDPNPSTTFIKTAGPAITDLNPDDLIIEFVAPDVTTTTPAEYIFTLTATDNLGFVSTDEVAITIAPNRKPILVSAGNNQSVTAGAMVTLTGSGEDPDKKPLNYSWKQIPSVPDTGEPQVALTNASTSQASFKAPDTDSGFTLTFELTVTDHAGLFDTAIVTVSVSPPPPPATKPADEKKGGALFWLLPLMLVVFIRKMSRRKNY